MGKDLIWASFLSLSTNMWGEQGAPAISAGFEDHLTTEDDIWTKVVDFLPGCGFNAVLIDVGDGIEYESHPELNIPGAWSKDKLKKELDRLRAMGLTPFPKLNFSTAHAAWLKDYRRMISSEPYYRVVEDTIKEVAEVFDHPALFHLGMDEELDPVQPNNLKSVRPQWLWWHDVNFMFNVCDKVGTRPWMWADQCWHDPDDYVKNMSKDTLQSNWYYGTLRRNEDGTFKRIETQTYHILEQAGFDQIPTFSACGGRWYSARQTLEMGKNDIAPERLKGFMSASWWFMYERYYYGMLHEAHLFKHAKAAVYPEECTKEIIDSVSETDERG